MIMSPAKSLNLAEISRSNIPPRTKPIFLKQAKELAAGLAPQINAMIEALDDGDEGQIQSLGAELKDMILKANLGYRQPARGLRGPRLPTRFVARSRQGRKATRPSDSTRSWLRRPTGSWRLSTWRSCA